MSKKVWFVKWNRPSKIFKGEKIGEWESYPTEELAIKKYNEVKETAGITDLTMGETECSSL